MLLKLLTQSFKSIILLLLVFVISSQCFAEEVFVNLKAMSLKYEEEGRIVTAVGSVEVRLKDFIIKSDIAKVNVDTGIATAEGNVVISSERYTAYSDIASYNASTEVTTLRNFSTVLVPEGIKGKVFIKAEVVDDLEEFTSGSEGDITTCDYDEPHYHIRARKFEYYPEDKIVGYSVTFYIGKVPVMWMPYFVYSLKRERASNMPIFGHNEVEGDFIKTSWDYFINNSAYGVVYLDLMEKKGFGHGFEHEYKLDRFNEGRFYIYHLNEQDTHITDWVAKLDHTVKFNKNTNLFLSHNYSNIYLIPSGRMDQTRSKIEFTHAKERRVNVGFNYLDDRYGHYQNYNFKVRHRFKDFDSNYLLNINRGTNPPRWSRLHQRVTHKQPFLFENSTFSTTFNYYKNATGEAFPSDMRLQPEIVINQKGDSYNLRVKENWYIDLDGDTYLADQNDEYLERQPEVECAFKPIDVSGFSVSNNVGWARFHEAKYVESLGGVRHFTTNRYKLGADVTRTDKFPLGTTITLSGGLDQFLYGPGDSRYAFREGATVRTELGGFFRNNINYKRGISEGNSPFFFDSVGNNYNNIKDTITLYYLDKVVWVVDGGYNFQTEKYFDLLTNLTVKPNERLRLYLASGYDIENQRYRDLVTGTHIIPFPGITGDINSVHDLNSGTLKSADSLFDLEIGDHWTNRWHIRVGNVYDFFTKRFLLRELMIVKDLHCWEVKFIYSDYRKQYMFSFVLKAFPEQPFGWSTTGGFFFEGFSKDEYMKESPRRY